MSTALSMASLVYPSSVSPEYSVKDMTTTPAVHPGLPSGDDYMHVPNIIIVSIFCVVCFLLLVAFFYAFCFRCTLQSSPKDGRTTAGCSMEREDATFRRSSSNPSLGNTI